MVTLPRLVVAAPASGHGKTTVATGLMAALGRTGYIVSGHKVGPDYIDPGYHALATGRPGRNLDPHLVGVDRVGPLLAHGSAKADIAVIEGVMGLFDGQIGGDGFASTAHIAALTGSPIVLVVDVSHASRSIAALVQGMASFDPRVRIAGVVVNKAGSPRHATEVLRSLEPLGIPVLGVLHRDDGVVAPSRHLGLVPAAERDDAARALDHLAGQVMEKVDLAQVVDIARQAPDMSVETWSPERALSRAGYRPPASPAGDRPVVAVAGGRAFTFRYAETTELLVAAGCEVATFDPLTDDRLPEGTRALYLGGGFPEVHAPALGANTALLRHVRDAIAAGLPTVAECAGLLYLCRSVDGVPMVGAIEADARMTSRLTLAYRSVATPAGSLLGKAGETATGHEFHRTTVEPVHGPTPAWRVGDDLVGFASPTLHASYLHAHWAGQPHLAAAFAEAAHRARPVADPAPAVGGRWRAVSTSDIAHHLPPKERVRIDPLRHHGDVEAKDGHLDFAVNVYDAPRPAWLESALTASLAASTAYPDSTRAAHTVARHHDRDPSEVLPTAGAAEAFGLIARFRPWQRPIVVHPQFTEPDVALSVAGHDPEHVHLDPASGFALDPALVPRDADLVIVGNPTNPTSVLHPAQTIELLLRPGRLVVVDEAFMDSVPAEHATLVRHRHPGLVVTRSLTKLWSVPGIRAGYVVGPTDIVSELGDQQTPWSVSTTALAVLEACSTDDARAEAARRASVIERDRAVLTDGLSALAIPFVTRPSGPFVLARPGRGWHAALRASGIAVRRADTFPGLNDEWIRIAVRPAEPTRKLLDQLSLERR